MKTSEKRLLSAALAVLLVMSGLIAHARLSAWQRKLETRKHQVSLESLEIEETLAEADEWRERRAWLEAHQPHAGSDLEADNLLYDRVLLLAAECQLTVQEKQYEAPVKAPHYRQSGVTLKVKGKLPAILRWIYFVQAPTECCTVPSLRITPDKNDASLVECRVVFWRWYQPNLSASS